jgi:hypothetical protein
VGKGKSASVHPTDSSARSRCSLGRNDKLGWAALVTDSWSLVTSYWAVGRHSEFRTQSVPLLLFSFSHCTASLEIVALPAPRGGFDARFAAAFKGYDSRR